MNFNLKNRFLILLIFFLFSYAYGDKKQIVFIVNPISHELKGFNVPKIIEQNLDRDKFEYKIVYTQYAQHATQLAHEALLNSSDIIAAVGGDGTVNEVGRALINTKATLAIIPVGSGNGLARHLGIPVGLIPAIKALNTAYPLVIDTGKINDKTFLGVAGIGFDAHVAHEFAHFGRRGFLSYCKVALKEFPKYKPQTYRITLDNKKITKKAFILTFANSSQYGNDFTIAPKAKINDGYLNLIIIDNIPEYLAPQFIYRCKRGTLNHSHHFETYEFKELTIQCPYLKAHIDGEPAIFHDKIKVTIVPHSLQIMVSRKVHF